MFLDFVSNDRFDEEFFSTVVTAVTLGGERFTIFFIILIDDLPKSISDYLVWFTDEVTWHKNFGRNIFVAAMRTANSGSR